MIAALILAAVLLTFLFNIVLANSSIQGDVDISGKGYVTLTVTSEDTLWTIAGEHMNSDYYTYESFIQEVCEMNGILDDTIYAGEQILIPVIASAQY